MRYVLIDRFLELKRGERVRAVKCVTKGEPFMAERESFPPPLALESLLQAGGALLRSESGFSRMTVLGKVEGALFPALARPGDRIEIDVESILSRPEGKLCKGVATVEGAVVAEAEFMILFVPPELEPPADAAREERAYLLRRALGIPKELEAK